MYNEKFHKDLKEGEKGERVIGEYLKGINFTNIIYNPNKNNEFDIKATYKGKEVLIEVKTDRWEHFKNTITNNIFIECECSNKPSGLFTSKANLYVYYFPDQETCYFIKTQILKDFIKDNKQWLIKTSQSGDGGKVRGYKINKIENKEMFKIVNIKKSSDWK
jgi:hypothetical protein